MTSFISKLLFLAVFINTSAAFAKDANMISLDEAIAKTLQSSPRLQAASAVVKASQSDERQAGAWQNPQVNLQAENFTGTGLYKGYDSAESTVGVTQLFEISGKPGRRKAIAREGVTISRYGEEAERLNAISDVKTAYANAIAAQERLRLATEQKTVADKLFGEVTKRVNAAREPLLQKNKAQITVSTARFAKEKAARELDHAKHVLSSLWAGHEGGFALKTDYYFVVDAPMSEQQAEEKLEKNPYLKQMQAQQEQMKAVHKLEQVEAVPDPTIGVNIRDFRNTDDQALVATVSFPLPVLNQNKGGIERAKQNIVRSASQTQSERLLLINELHEALESMINAYENTHNLKKSILPAAEKSFTQSRQGYNAGKFPYLEVLDAQRTLFQVKEQYIDTLNEYHTAKATVDRLTGATIQTTEASDAN